MSSRYCAAIAANHVPAPSTGVETIPPLTVAADELWRLTEHRRAVLLIGSYDGSGNYGDICQFRAALSVLSTLGPEFLLLPVIERQYLGSHLDLRARVASDFGGACFLYYAEQATDLDGGSPVELAPVVRPPGFNSSVVYFYGGGYLNEMWGRRKLAMADAVAEWVTSGENGRSQPLVVFTGQQVSTRFGDDPVAANWLRKAALFGVRDLQSAQNVSGRSPELVAGAALAVAEDDAVGILAGTPMLSEPADEPPDAGNGDFHVDLHLTGESYATADPKQLTRFVADLLNAVQHETAAHVSVRLLVAYDDRRISERPFAEDFAAAFPIGAGDPGALSFTVEDATRRHMVDPRWEQSRPDLTISCSYHVAMTSLLHDVPVVYLFGNEYYRQKAMSLQAGFGLSPELTVDVANPQAGAAEVARRAVALLSDPQRRTEAISRMRLGRARAVALRHLVSSRLIQLISAHPVSTLESRGTGVGQEAVGPMGVPGSQPKARRRIAERAPAVLRARLETLRSGQDEDGRVQDLERSVDELRATVESLSTTLQSVGGTTEGHTAWLTDLQTWMKSCVQMLTSLTDLPPIPSARVQASGPPARRRDDIEEIKRQLQIWTTMAWVETADVQADRLISVVMPTRNRCGWIERAIASIEAQTYRHWELIVVDDGSTDETGAVVAVATTRDKRIRCLHIEHAGAPAARNAGLADATGEIVCYLDDDNVMHRNWLKSVAWAIESWPQTEVLYGARIIEHNPPHQADGTESLPSMFFSPWDRRRLESSNYVDQNVIAHRAGLPEAHFDEALPMCQDWDLMLRMTARRRPLELPVLACFYSTTAPHRGSDQADQLATIHRVRAGAHLGRALSLLVIGRHPEDHYVGRIDSDVAALVDAGAHVASADARLELSEGADQTETGWLGAAVVEHDPDVVLVYGALAATELAGALAACGRPFAVRVTDSDDAAAIGDFLGHPLLLGLWQVPGRDVNGSLANFLQELAESLKAWKLDVAED